MTDAEISERAKAEKAKYRKEYRQNHKAEILAYQREYMKKYRKTERGKQVTRDANKRYWERKAIRAMQNESGSVAE